MLVIDGSQGEGGGQILRSSVALSMITGEPVTFEKIRAKRSRSGLMRQHLTAVRAAKAVCGATTKGDELKSKHLVFEPGEVRAGSYHFKVGTAGSATLVLQTVLPALMIADGPSEVIVEGGSHNPFAPSYDFLRRVYLPLIERMGPKVTLRLERHGFYPAGGARLVATIEPCPREQLGALRLMERGDERERAAVALLANLSEAVAERELSEVARLLGWSPESFERRDVKADGPGNVFWLEVAYEHVTAQFTAYGAKGKLAEHVAGDAIEAYRAYLTTQAVVGTYLADQLLLPMALAGHGQFLTGPPSQHLLTHGEVIEKFIEVDCLIERQDDCDGRVWKVMID